MDFRNALAGDAPAIAALHADSWRRNYRGSYSDAFLDGDVLADRARVWSARLGVPDSRGHTVVAEDGDRLVGFVHTILDHDPVWGALLDNLHVTHELRRTGVGSQLMAQSASTVLSETPRSGIYLWVLQANTAGQAFYRARGGRHEGSEWSEPPGGGSVLGYRYVWPDPARLV